MLSFDRTGFIFLIKFVALFACLVFFTKIGADFMFSPSERSGNAISAGEANISSQNKNRMAMVAAVLNAPDPVIKLGFVGDIMLDRRVKKSIMENGGGDYRFPFWRAANILQKYDILFGNLEGPISAGGGEERLGFFFLVGSQNAAAI